MKIAFINGSPKTRSSASKHILKELRTYLECDNNIIYEFQFNKPQLTLNEIDMQQLIECNAIVFTFPLYVDGIPSHMLRCLVQLETFFETINKKGIMVYTIVNCGFFEGHQNDIAIEIMQNWCAKSGLKWGQGIGIGAGGMMHRFPISHRILKNVESAFKTISSNILNCTSEECLFVQPSILRIAYKHAVEMQWRRSIKANGLKRKDLDIIK